MKRKAFVLTEILTGMALQSLFALTLCGAFYLLLSFSTSTQQILAAHDEGQIVISYIDTRIKNAGLGMWACKPSTTTSIGNAFTKISKIRDLPLPVAITKRSTHNTDVDDNGTSESNDKVYKGNVLTLLYAHKDHEQPGLIVLNDNMAVVNIDYTGNKRSSNFDLLGGDKVYGNSRFGDMKSDADISNYAAIESSGAPVRLMSSSIKHIKILAPTANFTSIDIHPMSELLNIECERMYTGISTGENSFMIRTLGVDSSSSKSEWNSPTPHTKGILEIYMELDTNPDVPIFDLRVLVSEGKSDGNTPKPEDWPQEYWKEEFEKHKLHVSRASWKLYNLAPIYH